MIIDNKYSPEAVKMVTEQLINMLSNNVLCDGGAEGFVGWIADGEVFEHEEIEEGEEPLQFLEAMSLVQEIAPLVDELTYKFLNVGY